MILSTILASAQPAIEAAEVVSEMDVEGLISDLAFILLLGAGVTLLFKWIKQPVVLGYIVAGFLASPNFEYLPSVTTLANIDFWAEIGIVIMLFSLGLEFSFKKLLNVGGSAVVTTLIIITGMVTVAFIVGHLWGFSNINCLYLGGMIGMSSTTIIIKAFSDLGLRQRKFAALVFGVLIVEDLFAVIMMVVLSSVAMNSSVDGGEMLYSISRLAFFLVIWFLAGVLILPSFLNFARRYLNNETLLIVSIGLCFGMAVFSQLCGFSMALGAFVMGSILAGTSMAESIERVATPVKDLFGAVFFISVGMMVSPGSLVEYWDSVLVLSLAVMFGGIVFGTSGMLITGQPLRIAMASGFSLTQIGEFSFIIASLGLSLGVLDGAIYPIIVAVSVITTFTTPYLIKLADPAYGFVVRHLPRKLYFLIDRYSSKASTETATRSLWVLLMRRYAWRLVLYSIVLVAICMLSSQFMMPWLNSEFESWGHLIGCLITLAVMSPFLLALALPVSSQTEHKRLQRTKASVDVPLVVMMLFRLILALGFVIYVFISIYGMRVGFSVGLSVIVLVALLFSSRVKNRLDNIESKFLNNLNERELRRSGRNNNVISDLHLAYMDVGYGCPFVGERLRNSNLRNKYGVNIVSIQRGGEGIPLPSGDTRIFPGDTIGVIGTDEQLQLLLHEVEASDTSEHNALKGVNPSNFKMTSVLLTDDSVLIGKSATTANLRREYAALVVALQRGEEYVPVDGSERFCPGDVVWLVGDPHLLTSLK